MDKNILSYKPINCVQRKHILAVSKVSRHVLRLLRLISPVYMKHILLYSHIQIQKIDLLIEYWKKFQDRKVRLIFAFRHPYGDEPQLFAYVFSNLLFHYSHRSENPLIEIPHARFVHGYEVALWGDALIRWVLPRMGAVPIFHSRFDSAGMKVIRHILANDEYPLALAPEGQVSYRSETIPRLETGTARMGFWCAQDLEKENRSEEVIILPLTVYHEYNRKDYKKLEKIVERLEHLCGLHKLDSNEINSSLQSPLCDNVTLNKNRDDAIKKMIPPEKWKQKQNGKMMFLFETDMVNRLIKIESKLIVMTELYYQESYGYLPSSDIGLSNEERQIRWDELLLFALDIAERILGISQIKPYSHQSDTQEPIVDHSTEPREHMINRVYKIRQVGWDRIYADIPEDASKLQKNVADRRAGEAWYAMRHMEFVDLVYYLDTKYLEGNDKNSPSYDRIVETAFNLYDIISRLSGGNFSNRLNTIRKKAIVYPCNPINLTERLQDYKKNWKSAVNTAMTDLNESFQNNIKEYLDGKEQQ